MFTKKRVVIGVIIIFLVILIASLNKPKNTDKRPEPSKNTAQANYLVGIGYSHFNDLLGEDVSVKKISGAANLIYLQGQWKDTNYFNTTLKTDIDEAKKDNLAVYIAIEAFNPERTKIDLPNGLSGNFNNPAVKSEYLNFIKKIALTYKPEYLILNVEANQLKKYDADTYQSYLPVYYEAYDIAKKASPNTKVSVSLVLASADQNSCIKNTDLTKLKEDLSDFKKIDMFAVSVYPMCFLDPNLIPNDFLLNIAKLSDKPLFISETGWVSGGLPGIGSEGNQANFIRKLKEMASQTIKNSTKIEAINYVGLIDPSKNSCDLIVSYNPALSWYCNLALIRPDGSEKPAYQEFLKLKSN